MATDIYMKITGVDGESKTAGYESWFEVQSFSFGISQSGSFGKGKEGGGTGQASCSDLNIVKYVDKASPTLYKLCAQGEHFDKIELHLRKAGDKPITYMKIELEPALISGISHGASNGSDIPTEQISFNYEQIKVIYQGQEKKGTKGGGEVVGGYNLATKAAI